MTLPDPIGDIRNLLLADAGVTAITSLVYGGELPEEEAANMPQAAVVIAPSGGLGRLKTMLTRTIRVDTTCYGATLHDSWNLHLAVREALETMSRPTGSVKTIEMASEAANARDSVKQWPTCYASYTVLTTTAV